MIKKVFGRKLSRGRKARKALFRSQIRALVLSGKITTTYAKAKSIQGKLDSIIALAIKKDLAGRRKVLGELANNKEIVGTIFNKIAPTFTKRVSGFTRIVPLPPRKGDMAKMGRLEWSQEIVTTSKKEVKKVKEEKTPSKESKRK